MLSFRRRCAGVDRIEWVAASWEEVDGIRC